MALTYDQWVLVEGTLEKKRRQTERKLQNWREKPHWEPGQSERLRHSQERLLRTLTQILSTVRVEKAAALKQE